MDHRFNEIFDNYNKDIFRLIYSYTLDIFESKDILQETFLKFYKNMDKLPYEQQEIKKWLIKVSANLSKDYLRKIKRHKTYNLEDNNLYVILEPFNIEFIEILRKLNNKYRIPIYLYYYEGYKIEEISNILNIKQSAVKMRLARAKKILKEEMEKI